MRGDRRYKSMTETTSIDFIRHEITQYDISILEKAKAKDLVSDSEN